jgi:hypothetical protein
MSVPSRAPGGFRPGAPPPHRRWGRFAALTAGDATTCEQAPIVNKDQRGDSRNATTRSACDIGAYDTGGA